MALQTELLHVLGFISTPLLFVFEEGKKGK